jgi:hypothetical protein
MTDRTDIDALLIGALYGELTPADEARLTAHLESHPADRTSLDDLTRTRAAVRESRILAFQAEPPAAVSALLLQEASRRAPRPEPSEGWFQRFVRMFAAHPAMAAAATVVLVLGVTGMLYLRGADPFAKSSSQPPPASAVAPAASETAAAEKAAPAPMPESPAAAADPQATPGAPSAGGGAASTGAAAGSAGYRVDLDDTSRDKGAAGSVQGDSRGKDQQSAEPSDGVGRRAGFEVGGKADRADLAKTKAEAPAKRAAAPRGIELRRPEPTPKELKDSDDEAQLAQDRANGRANDRAKVRKLTAESEAARSQLDRAPAADERAGAMAPPPPPPASAVAAEQAPPPAQAAAPSAAPASDAKHAAKAPGNALNNAPNAGGAPPAPSTNQVRSATNQPAAKPGPTNLVGGNATVNDKAAESALQAWARNKRDQVVALVNANNCDAAADVAMDIYNRAPSYFSSMILTDREVKPCLVYVNRQRARAERARAAKNANSADTEAPSRK